MKKSVQTLFSTLAEQKWDHMQLWQQSHHMLLESSTISHNSVSHTVRTTPLWQQTIKTCEEKRVCAVSLRSYNTRSSFTRYYPCESWCAGINQSCTQHSSQSRGAVHTSCSYTLVIVLNLQLPVHSQVNLEPQLWTLKIDFPAKGAFNGLQAIQWRWFSSHFSFFCVLIACASHTMDVCSLFFDIDVFLDGVW